MELKKKFKNKRILIVGLGLQGGGVGLVKFFHHLSAYIRVVDLKSEKELKESLIKIRNLNVEIILGKHRREDFLWPDVIFKGPSVPWDLPYLQEAIKKGIRVEMELSFFASICAGKIIGITGSRGKSTTTVMIYELLKKNNFPVHLGGNVSGVSTISLIEKVRKDDWVVLELSSWNLSGFHQKRISPHLAVFTNFYPDHLNFYNNMGDYLYDKKAIYLYQKSTDYLIANKALKPMIEEDKTKSKTFYFNQLTFPDKTKLLGLHNKENAGAALLAAKILKIEKEKTIGVLKNFSGLPFRLQKVGKVRGIEIYNDTTSTTPVACEKAIDALSGKKITLILGGNSKRLPYQNLIAKINHAVSRIVLLKGTFTDEIIPLIDRQRLINKEPFDNLKMAVGEALKKSYPDSVILFSPAATSFAMFNNEFHRGEEFNKIVKELI